MERVDLIDIGAQHGPHGGEFLLKAGNLGRVVAFYAAELLEKFLRATLFAVELLHERVVLDGFFQFVILQGELRVLVLHLLFVEPGQFLKVGVTLFLFFVLAIEIEHADAQQDDEHGSDGNDDGFFFLHNSWRVEFSPER